MDVDTTRLRSFLHVAELGTVAESAQTLGFTGPAVSQHLSKLETQLGLPLFERAGGRLALSVHGHQLVPIAAAIIDLTDRIAASLAAPTRERRVCIAGFSSAIRTIVLPATNKHRDVVWDIREAEDDEALRALRLGAADIALIQEYSNRPEPRASRLRYTELARDRLRLVGPPGTRRNATLAEMATSAWLINGTGTRCETATQLVLNAAGITPHVVGRISDTTTLFALVASGHGATLAPERMLAESTPGVVVSTTNLGVTRKTYAVQRESTQSINRDIVNTLRTAASSHRERAT